MSRLTAVFDQPPTPCEVFKCPEEARCRARRLACQAFAAYVRHGKALDPRSVLQQNAAGRAVFKGLGEKPEPSAVIFKRLYARTDRPEAAVIVEEGS